MPPTRTRLQRLDVQNLLDRIGHHPNAPARVVIATRTADEVLINVEIQYCAEHPLCCDEPQCHTPFLKPPGLRQIGHRLRPHGIARAIGVRVDVHCRFPDAYIGLDQVRARSRSVCIGWTPPVRRRPCPQDRWLQRALQATGAAQKLEPGEADTVRDGAVALVERHLRNIQINDAHAIAEQWCPPRPPEVRSAKSYLARMRSVGPFEVVGCVVTRVRDVERSRRKVARTMITVSALIRSGLGTRYATFLVWWIPQTDRYVLMSRPTWRRP